MVVGASVLGVTYKDGVLLMADTAASYGSLARFTNIPRLHKVNDKTLVGFSGELSDWQHLEHILKQVTIDDYISGDGIQKSPEEIHAFLCRVLHGERNTGDPLWLQVVTAGFTTEDDKPFLGYCDMYGTNFKDKVMATGFGLHMALPLLRKAHRDDMTEEEAKELLTDAMRVLLYRHCRTVNKFTMAKIDREGITISAPFDISTKWDYKRFINPRAQEVQQIRSGQPVIRVDESSAPAAAPAAAAGASME